MSDRDDTYDHNRERDGKTPGADMYDLVVVGGGSAAFAAALKVSELDRRVAIVNAGLRDGGLPIGGTA